MAVTKFKDWLASLGVIGTPADADEIYWRDASGNVSKRETSAALTARLTAGDLGDAGVAALIDDAGSDTTAALAAQYAPLTESLYIPALLWKSAVGTVTEGMVNRVPVQAINRDAGIGTEVVVPSHWNTFAVSIRWLQNDGGTGDVSFTTRYASSDTGAALTQPVSGTQQTVIVAVAASGIVSTTAAHASIPVDPDVPIDLNIIRPATSDTWGTNPVRFLGTYLERLT